MHLALASGSFFHWNVAMGEAQSEFHFSQPDSGRDGLLAWREIREKDLRALARRLGLPLGHPAEVWLLGGIRLHGLLELDEQQLFPQSEKSTELVLRIGATPFRTTEIESCIRLD